MATSTSVKVDGKSIYENENETFKSPEDPTMAIYLEFAAHDDQWKALHSKKLLRKVDIRLLPFLALMYLLNYLDRTNLAQARLGTLEKDLNMHGDDFNIATSILFVGYLLMQVPSNLLLTRARPSLYLGLAMSAWGVISAAQAASQTFGGFVACRTLLGVVEAPFFPGAVMLMSSWYTREELALRIACFYSGTSVANMFGGLLSAGVLGNLSGAHGISGWRWLFIIEGTITVGVALISIFFLPNYPATSMWLSEEERTFAQWRLIDDAKESDDTDSITLKEGLLLALQDYRVWVFALFQHISLLSQTFTYFFPTIVKTLGYNNTDTLLLTAPVWFLTFIVSLFVTWTSGRTGDRSIHIISLLCISLIGNIIAISTLKTGPRFFAMFLMPLGSVSAYQIIVAWVANSFPRPLVKRSAAIAICNMLGNSANIYGPYMYPSSDGPRYLAGGAVIAGACLLTAIGAFIIRLIHIKENKKLERVERDNIVQEGDARAAGFRYIY